MKKNTNENNPLNDALPKIILSAQKTGTQENSEEKLESPIPDNNRRIENNNTFTSLITQNNNSFQNNNINTYNLNTNPTISSSSNNTLQLSPKPKEIKNKKTTKNRLNLTIDTKAGHDPKIECKLVPPTPKNSVTSTTTNTTQNFFPTVNDNQNSFNQITAIALLNNQKKNEQQKNDWKIAKTIKENIESLKKTLFNLETEKVFSNQGKSNITLRDYSEKIDDFVILFQDLENNCSREEEKNIVDQCRNMLQKHSRLFSKYQNSVIKLPFGAPEPETFIPNMHKELGNRTDFLEDILSKKNLLVKDSSDEDERDSDESLFEGNDNESNSSPDNSPSATSIQNK